MPVSFTRLHRDNLKRLTKAATGDAVRGLTEFLTTHGTSVVEFSSRADVYSVLLPVLAEDYDIDLETSENEMIADLAEACEALIFILTLDEQAEYLTNLSPEQFSPTELNDAYEAFTEDSDKEAGKAMLTCITALHQALSTVDENHVVVAMVSSP